MNPRLICLTVLVLVLAGCGGSSPSSTPTIAPARNYELANFKPAGVAKPNTPTTVSFVIRNPDGSPLTAFKRGPGPHTGVHLILVRSDLAYIVHRHPPIAADGTIRERITFPAPGTYRAVVDVYPRYGDQPNFQLFRTVRVAGVYHRQPLPPFSQTRHRRRLPVHDARKPPSARDPGRVPDGDRHGSERPAGPLRAVVRGTRARDLLPQGLARLLPHARLRTRSRRLHEPARRRDVSPGPRRRPGKLTVGVLVPVAGTWRLFLQCQVNGHILTAPFTLKVT